MVSYQFTFLIGSLAHLLIWLVLFLYKKNNRREMLFFSWLAAFLSPFTEYFFWTVDWWHPQTITMTRIGIEDLIVGFAGGGIASVIYEDIFGKRFFNNKTKINFVGMLKSVGLLLILTSVLFYYFKFTSFLSFTLPALILGTLMIIRKKELLMDSVWSGLLLVLSVLPVYFLMIFISPGWVQATYDVSLSGIRPFGIPIEELIFYFSFGFYVGPVYEYWRIKDKHK